MDWNERILLTLALASAAIVIAYGAAALLGV